MTAIRRPLVLLAVALGLAIGAFVNPLASTAVRYSREAVVATAATYATLRAASAMMAVLKDADFGVVVQVSPGQILEPVTTTIERFADIVFAAALVATLVTFLLGPAASVGAGAAALALAGLALSTVGRAGTTQRRLHRWLRMVAAGGLALALLLPLAYAGAFWLGELLTADATARAAAALGQIAQESDEGAVVEGSWLQQLRDAVALDRARSILAMAGELFGATVDLAVAYLVKLVVLPLLLALAGWWLFRAWIAADGIDQATHRT